MSNRSLAREVAVAVLVKLAVVIAASVLIFGPANRPKIDAERVEARLIGTPDLNPQVRIAVP